MEHEGEAVPLGFGGGVAGPVRLVCPGSAGLYPANGGAGLRPVLCLGGGDASGGLGLFRQGLDRVHPEGTEKRELVPNGVGGYTGLDFPGQTIYFSRVLAEPLDAPTLQIAAADSAIAVFLDDVPLYADFDREKAAIARSDCPRWTLTGPSR